MADVMHAWAGAGQQAILDDVALRPRTTDASSTVPLVTRGGQAWAYHLVDDNDEGWILKKFLPGRQPGPAYLNEIRALIPNRPGFESGFGRKVLDGLSVAASAYCEPEFQSWVSGTILMRQVVSPTWAELAASIREGAKVLSRVERLFLCAKLSEELEWLESAGLAHRDLSSTNVMVDPVNIDVHLIDWDSLFHSTLLLPPDATPGTEGYMAPFVGAGGGTAARLTWQEHSDRFALAILNAEILSVNAGSPVAGEGGLFEQEDLSRRAGRTVSEVRHNLQHHFPAAAKFLDAALGARSFEKCPGPTDWINLINRELPNSAQAVWEEEGTPVEEAQSVYAPSYVPHFVGVNSEAFVRVDRKAFVKAPPSHRQSERSSRHD
jgi:serine/threonine protein kinase